jgi:uncharacterized circularly permuted ATP-grasp superfamily protein
MDSSLVKQAIDHFHELLSGGYLSSTRNILAEGTERRKLSFHGRPTCTVLRPYFISESTYSFVRNASTLVLHGIATLRERLLTDSILRRELDLSTEEEEIIRIDPGGQNPDASARLDGFLTGDGQFHFVEYNADSPGGIAFGAELGDLFQSMPIFHAFASRFPVHSIPVRTFVFETLMNRYKDWGGKRLPNIAIIDWKGVGTYNEFLLLEDFFEKQGCRAKIADPSQLEYRKGQLFVQDFRIDLVYKRLLVSELLEKFGLHHPLIDAVRDRAVCMANGFGVQILTKKIIFALLSDPAYAPSFEPEVAQALLLHIPWTRKVREANTSYQNQKIDLIPFAEKNRERLVLKPSGEYGGKGVVLGWESDQANWNDALKTALSGSYIVQERVPLGQETFPSIEDGELHFEPRFLDLDPYVWDGRQIEGCGVRLSRAALLNVSAGGGSAVPMFIVKDAK